MLAIADWALSSSSPFRSIIILSLIAIIGVVSCFILCSEEKELRQEVALDTPLKEAYADIFKSIEESERQVRIFE